jgi:capsular polysaccharide biosynthesis protein/Mrp family chromosome partitioning ATPase
MQRETPSNRDIRDEPSSFELVTGLRRYLPTIAVAALVGAIAALFVSFAQPPRYTSTASIIIETIEDSSSATKVNMATEKQIASSTAVAGAVIRELHLEGTPEDVLGGLGLSVPVDTEVLVLSYTATDPAQAQRRAQAFAEAYLDYRGQALLEAGEASNAAIQARIDALRADLHTLTSRAASELDPGKRAALEASTNSVLAQIGIQEQQLASQASALTFSGRQLAAASFPTSPSGPKVVVNVILGLFVGAVVGTLVALGRAVLGGMHSEGEVAHAVGAPILAVIPRSGRATRGSPIVVTERASPTGDAYRRLVVKLLTSPSGTPPAHRGGRTIAVVGLDDGSDTAIAVANLGAAMALSGRSVLLAAATAEGAGLEATFNTRLSPGLSDVIRRDASLSEAIRATRFSSLKVLPGGSEEGRWALLDTKAVGSAMEQMASSADVVIVNAPARAAAETGALVAACDELLLVGSLRATSLDDARRTRVELEGLGTPCIGIVVFEHRPPHRRRSRPQDPLDAERTDGVNVDSDWPGFSSGPSSTGAALSSPAGTRQRR